MKLASILFLSTSLLISPAAFSQNAKNLLSAPNVQNQTLLDAPVPVPPLTEAQCPSVDLSASFGPVRSQRQLGWCFAYAASDLATKVVGFTASPFDIAISVYRNRPALQNGEAFQISKMSGGTLSETFNALRRDGICDGTKFSAEGDQAAKALPQVENLAYEVYNALASGDLKEGALASMLKAKETQLKAVFPKSTLEELEVVFAQTGPATYPLLAVVDQICGERTKLPNFDYGYNDGPKRFQIMSSSLQHGMPVYIAYSEKSIENLDYVGRFGHASSVVGMRFDQPTQKCEFLIRNSYGPEWPKKANERLDGKYADGYVWLDETNMSRIVGIVGWVR